MCTQTISKWGSSLAFRLLAAFAKQMRLEEGAKVELAIDSKRLVVQRAESAPDAKTFFAAVKASQSAHDLVRVGKARGKEIR
jgi:antitoxin component of MazEF toxin-antitoxin module